MVDEAGDVWKERAGWLTERAVTELGREGAAEAIKAALVGACVPVEKLPAGAASPFGEWLRAVPRAKGSGAGVINWQGVCLGLEAWLRDRPKKTLARPAVTPEQRVAEAEAGLAAARERLREVKESANYAFRRQYLEERTLDLLAWENRVLEARGEPTKEMTAEQLEALRIRLRREW